MGTDSVIYIRTDGNSKIATGHLVRCLCIAQALENLGKKICFLVSDSDSESLLQDLAASVFAGYRFSFMVRVLETAVYNDLELELFELEHFLTGRPLTQESVITSTSKPLILIDSYYVTPDYLYTLRKIAKIAYIDDLRAFDYDVDIVINYDVIPVSQKKEYIQSYTNADIKLLGADYTPLRSQFQNQEVTLRENIENILITTGGSDPYYFTEDIISYLISQGFAVDVHVVVGRLFTNIESLKTLANQSPFVHLHYNVSDMAALMKQCDYAISAAGTTLYELCALGIPAISITMADNQIIMAETFALTGAVPYAGDVRNKDAAYISDNRNKHAAYTGNIQNRNIVPVGNSENTKIQTIFTCINDHLSTLLQNYSERTKQHQNMRHLVDGNGAIRIAGELCRL